METQAATDNDKKEEEEWFSFRISKRVHQENINASCGFVRIQGIVENGSIRLKSEGILNRCFTRVISIKEAGIDCEIAETGANVELGVLMGWKRHGYRSWITPAWITPGDVFERKSPSPDEIIESRTISSWLFMLVMIIIMFFILAISVSEPVIQVYLSILAFFIIVIFFVAYKMRDK